MSSDPKFDKAQKLIKAFAKQLLALNDGRKIPTAWAISLKKTLTPKSGKTGRKHVKAEEVVKAVMLAGDTVKQPRTKHHNPAEHKDRIAKKSGTSRRTVERRMNDITRCFTGDDTLPQETRDIVLTGSSDALAEVIRTEMDQEEKARQQIETRRRNRR